MDNLTVMGPLDRKLERATGRRMPKGPDAIFPARISDLGFRFRNLYRSIELSTLVFFGPARRANQMKSWRMKRWRACRRGPLPCVVSLSASEQLFGQDRYGAHLLARAKQRRRMQECRFMFDVSAANLLI
jgi:hypothetical protein